MGKNLKSKEHPIEDAFSQVSATNYSFKLFLLHPIKDAFSQVEAAKYSLKSFLSLDEVYLFEQQKHPNISKFKKIDLN